MSKKTYDVLKEIFMICAIAGAILIDLTPVISTPGITLAGAILSTVGTAGLKYLAESSKNYFADKLIVGPDDVIEPEAKHEDY